MNRGGVMALTAAASIVFFGSLAACVGVLFARRTRRRLAQPNAEMEASQSLPPIVYFQKADFDLIRSLGEKEHWYIKCDDVTPPPGEQLADLADKKRFAKPSAFDCTGFVYKHTPVTIKVVCGIRGK